MLHSYQYLLHFLFVYTNDFQHQLIYFAILFSSFIFYVPIWRARLYFQKLKRLGINEVNIFKLINQLCFIFNYSRFLRSNSVYLFFVFNAFTLCAFTVKEFSRTVFYQIKYKNQYLLGLSAILLIYLIQFNVAYTITGIMVLLFIGYYKLNKLRLQW